MHMHIAIVQLVHCCSHIYALRGSKKCALKMCVTQVAWEAIACQHNYQFFVCILFS